MSQNSLTAFLLIGLTAYVFSTRQAESAVRAGDQISVSFQSKADKSLFVDVRSTTPDSKNLASAYSPDKGIGGSGGLTAINVGTSNKNNDFAVYYAPGGIAHDKGRIILKANQTLSMQIDFKVFDSTCLAAPRMGISSLKELMKRTKNGTQLNIAGAKDTVGGGPVHGIAMSLASAGSKSVNITNCVKFKKVKTPDPKGPYALKKGRWYQMVLKIYKTPTNGQFDVQITLNELNPSGKVSRLIGQHSAHLTNLEFYKTTNDGALAGFTFSSNNKKISTTKEFDNFKLEIKNGNLVGPVLAASATQKAKGTQGTPPTPANQPNHSIILNIGDVSIIIQNSK